MGFLRQLNEIVGFFGYPQPTRWAINRAPVDLSLNINGDLSNRLYFDGDISVKKDSKIENDVEIRGDVSIGRNAYIGEGTRIRGSVDIGKYTNLVRDDWVRGDVDIGKFCAIAQRTAIQAANVDFKHFAVQQRWQRELVGADVPPDQEKIKIGSDVWIARDVIVLAGTEIGHGACIGAGSVVTRDVEPYEVVAGVPNEHIKWRFPEEVREELLEKQWWDWEYDKIRENWDELGRLVNSKQVKDNQ